jgi:hypothetical protein
MSDSRWAGTTATLLGVGVAGRSAIDAFCKCIGLLDFVIIEQAMHSLCMLRQR